ncbi:nagb/rpia/CoA transferase-like protein [Auriculariales sp. MPI-PUGE-AT-0066]|nr:nagb/rpia/CoA transferase-like protein [Auriculariales sp. MPI-PUGE-AT-0066]
MSTSVTAAALRAQKRTLRKSMATTLKGLSDASVDEQSALLTTRLLQSPLISRAQNVALYLGMPHGEVRTDALARALIERGKTLYLPRIVPIEPPVAAQLAVPSAPSTKMVMLKIQNIDDLSAIQPSGPWGLREPTLDGRESASTLDLILCPGVAFDRSLPHPQRLGHGKGYYDTFIRSLSTPTTSSHTSIVGRQPILVALALREQLLDAGAVPTDALDVPLDFVVTPMEWFPSEPKSTSSA